MSAAAGGGGGKPKKQKAKDQPVRVAVRCSWSGARLTVPPSAADAVTISSTIASVLCAITTRLPPAVFENEGSNVVYMRKSVPRSEWDTTTLAELGVDACSGGSGVILTLNLGGGGGNSSGGGGAATAAAAAGGAVAVAVAASTGPAAAAVATPEPMEVDNNDEPDSMDVVQPAAPSPAQTTRATPEEALSVILSSNFDADSKPCLLTLIKILDNIIAKPNDAKVRSIRLGNAVIEKKIVRVKGGVEFLYACGFTPVYPSGGIAASAFGDNNDARSAAPAAAPEAIELLDRNEDTDQLVEARRLLATRAVNVLGVETSSIPNFRPPPPPAASKPSASSAAAGPSRSSGGGGAAAASFDPYKTHSYSSAAAAAGAPNPHSVIPTEEDGKYVSKTEKELNLLKSRQEKLERKMQKELGADRGLVALRPGQVAGPISTLRTGGDDDGAGAGGGGGGGGGKGDGSLLAARMKRLEEERKKREEGGFTTRAMRDLESMKKARVYSHAQLRVCFSDGVSLSAKFLPGELVKSVVEVVRGALRDELRNGLDFDLYVAPPRRLLDSGKKLVDEGLVPAAKVHVSWKVGGAPPAPLKGEAPGAYLRPELFEAAAAAGGAAGGADAATAFPDTKKLVGDGKEGKKRPAGSAGGEASSSASASASKESREEALMRRMLGKKPSLLGRKGSSASSDGGGGTKKDGGGSGGGGGKPRWFKG